MNCRGSEKGRSAIFKADETEPREGRGISTEGEEDKFISRWKHPLKPSANQGGPSVIKAWHHVTFVSPARRLGSWGPRVPGITRQHRRRRRPALNLYLSLYLTIEQRPHVTTFALTAHFPSSITPWRTITLLEMTIRWRKKRRLTKRYVIASRSYC